MKGVRPPPPPPDQARLARVRERPCVPPDPLTRGDLAIGLLLFAAALGLRLLHLGEPSLWVDEAASLSFTRASWEALWTTVPLVETNPPAYYALLKGWIAGAGEADAMLRLPGVLAGALSVLALYLMAQRRYGRGVAVVAATLLALSAPQVAHAQEARVFAFVTLAVVLGLALVNRVAEALVTRTRAWPWLMLLALAIAALPHLHYSGFFAAVVLLVYALALFAGHGVLGRAAWRLVPTAALTLALAAPPIYWTLHHVGAAESPVGWLAPPSIWDAKWVYHQSFGLGYLPFGRPAWLPAELPDHRAFNLLATRRLGEIALTLVCAVALVAALRRSERTVPALALALLTLVLLFFAVSQVKPILLQRTVIFGLPLMALIAGYGVMALRWVWLVGPAALALFTVQALDLAAYYPRAEKEPWRAVIARLARETPDPGSTALLLASGTHMSASLTTATLVAHYWPDHPPAFAAPPAHGAAIHRAGLALAPWLDDLGDLSDEALCLRLRGAERIVVLFRHPDHLAALAPRLDALGGTVTGGARNGLLGFEVRRALTCGD